MVDEAEWKRRFGILMLVRLGGLLLFMAGVVIVYTDVLRPGGWPQLGAVLALCGLIDAVFAPRLLKRMWDKA